MLKEFGEFIKRGNVMDLAVGVIIGAAFGKVVTSLVDDLIMPPIGMAMGGADFSDLKAVLKPDVLDAAGKVTTPEVAIKYGAFINTIIQFLIVAFCIFMIVKAMNKMMKPAPAPEAAPAPPAEDVVLLTEIRDLLKSR
jgi:large conductance mechanosensitive channel